MNFFHLRIVLLLLILFFGLVSRSSETDGTWFAETDDSPKKSLPVEDGEVEFHFSLPGSALIYFEKDRTKLRLTPEEFKKGKLVYEVKLMTPESDPVRGSLFVKDKDGWWFQDRNEFQLISGDWQRLELDLTPESSPLTPVGHQGAWSSFFAASRLTSGLSIYGGPSGSYVLKLRPLRQEGERVTPALRIFNWQLPAQSVKNQPMQSTFQLSRDYFNPFDPDEIQIDYEVRHPDGRTERRPAFYTIDYTRRRHFTTELNMPVGRPYWAFRFTPEQPGEYQFRLHVVDRSGQQPIRITGPWRSQTAAPSDLRGFVRRSQKDYRYLEFADGEFFFPIGINIHTNVDLRSEMDFKLGHLPDQGTYDYDEYFEGLLRGGINAVEIWMAAWSFAIEWNSARQNYHGLGRYNLCNAWRLDQVLNNARSKNLYIHLTLDNHTKHTSLEWGDNPYNSTNEFKIANGAFLEESPAFFSDPRARKLNRQRNRYIAARWGADPAIFGIEFWSEVDLVDKFQDLYEQESIIDWHREAVRDFRANDQGRHLLTTHYCGNFERLLRWYRLIDLPEFDYAVGDAYRSLTQHFVDLVISHSTGVKYFERPAIITEYGGPSSGANQEAYKLGDLHSANWLAFFLGQTATPFIWWHDFVHINNHYPHYRGFADFIKGIDLRQGFDYRRLQVAPRRAWLERPLAAHERVWRNLVLNGASNRCHLDFVYNWTGFPIGSNYVIQGLSMAKDQLVMGWIFCRNWMNTYPADNEPLDFFRDYVFQLDFPLPPGRYQVTYYHTISNRVLAVQDLTITPSGPEPALIPVPPFQIDIAFKITPKEGVQP